MKLEVGMYVRTIKGISRIEEITEDRTEIYFNCDTGLTISFIKKDFTQEEMAEQYNHSYIITDLIEAGDYVNGNKVININGNLFVNDDSFKPELQNVNIKSIVTKEMFSNVEYRVETN